MIKNIENYSTLAQLRRNSDIYKSLIFELKLHFQVNLHKIVDM